MRVVNMNQKIQSDFLTELITWSKSATMISELDSVMNLLFISFMIYFYL